MVTGGGSQDDIESRPLTLAEAKELRLRAELLGLAKEGLDSDAVQLPAGSEYRAVWYSADSGSGSVDMWLCYTPPTERFPNGAYNIILPGTDNMAIVGLDLKIWPSRGAYGTAGHDGFNESPSLKSSAGISMLDQVQKWVSYAQSKGAAVVIAGHSYGGATVRTLLDNLIVLGYVGENALTKNDLWVPTYGTPAAHGRKGAAITRETYGTFCESVIMPGDNVVDVGGPLWVRGGNRFVTLGENGGVVETLPHGERYGSDAWSDRQMAASLESVSFEPQSIDVGFDVRYANLQRLNAQTGAQVDHDLLQEMAADPDGYDALVRELDPQPQAMLEGFVVGPVMGPHGILGSYEPTLAGYINAAESDSMSPEGPQPGVRQGNGAPTSTASPDGIASPAHTTDRSRGAE